MMSFVFFVVFGPDRTLAGNEGNQHVYGQFIWKFWKSLHFHTSRISIRIYFLCVQLHFHQKIPIRNFRCVEGNFLTESTEVTRMEREKESSELASRVELFVVRSAAGFPIDF